jgi:hypothetical protein
MKLSNPEQIAKWEAELERIEDQILKNIRWGDARRFAARTSWNRHIRRHWLIEHISDAKAREFKREGAPANNTACS